MKNNIIFKEILTELDQPNDYRFPFSPYPRGWFAVSHADTVEPEEVIAAKIFNTDIVIYKTANNEVVVVDAYCPHLGAHLAHGGTVEGDNIVCPFHGWKYSKSGKLIDIPHVENPMKACLKVWRSEVVDGMVMVWYCPENSEPDWFMPETDTSGWSQSIRPDECTWIIRSHPQELLENAVDLAHFPKLHPVESLPTEAKFDFDTPHAVMTYKGVVSGEPLGLESLEGHFKLTMHGLGALFVENHLPSLDLTYRTHIYQTPLNEQECYVQMVTSVIKQSDEQTDMDLLNLWTPMLVEDFNLDILMWENKKYIERPLTSKVDGPFKIYRNWCKQFYNALISEVA